LHAALLGGGITYEFFAGNMGALQDVAQFIANGGDSVWKKVDEASSLGLDFLVPDQPAYYVQASKGQIVVQVQASHDVLQQDTQDYKEAGIATTYLVTNQGAVDVMINYIEKLGPPIAAATLAPTILTILGAFKTFVQTFLTRAYSAASSGATDAEVIGEEAAAEAAEEAAVDGEIVADEIALSLTFSPLAIAGIIIATIALVITIILFFLSKTMTCIVKFYNLSDQSFTLGICYADNLSLIKAPRTGILQPVGVPPAPPGVKALDEVIYRADYIFQNDTSVEGVEAVFQGYGDNGLGFTFVIDVPAAGSNSLSVGLNPSSDCETLAETVDANGRYQQLTMTTDNGHYKLSIATNQLSGESQSPLTGENGYYYEYLVLFEQVA
jgi:hypothetical protein